LIKNMEEAVSLAIEHIKTKNKICIYGDYDADGITSSALLFEILKIFKVECQVYIPDRVGEGYGLNVKALNKIKKQGVKLIITVDGGIRNKEEVKYAKEIGLDIIITDHHTPPEDEKELPECLIVNPLLKGNKYPFKYLAGVGVAFKFASALIGKSKLKKEDKEKLEIRVLDLVALGTVADCVPLLGENRVILREGLKVLNNTRRVGLKELIKKAGIEKKDLKSWNIGFQIGPRLNASSRMGSAVAAFNILVTKDKEEALEKAEKLNNKNIKRQKETDQIVAEVEEQIKDQLEEKIIIGINSKVKSWNEGIIGLVSGRITEKYYKPSLILTKTEEGYKASGRSIEEFNLFKAIEECSDLLGKHGGHPMACGLSVDKENLEKFERKIRKIAKRELENKNLIPKLKIDIEIPLEEVDKSFFKDIEKLAPFGQANPQPKFLSKDVRLNDILKIGKEGQHIKFLLGRFWGIAFNKACQWSDFRIGDRVDIVYNLEINEFNGREELQLKIIDIKLSE
jgi:single-stranded-DNA-specific exonuclease